MKVQVLLIILPVIFDTKYSVILLFIHGIFSNLFGPIYSSKASSLARKKYPDVIAYTSFIGKGFGWDPYIEKEAERLGDTVTVEMLRFNRYSICLFLLAMLIYILSLMIPAYLQAYIG